MARFRLARAAIQDLDQIWRFIARDSEDAANRVEQEFFSTFRRLADSPFQGRVRADVTALPVRFWIVPRFPNYIVVYRPRTKPLQIMRVLHAKRDLKQSIDPS